MRAPLAGVGTAAVRVVRRGALEASQRPALPLRRLGRTCGAVDPVNRPVLTSTGRQDGRGAINNYIRYCWIQALAGRGFEWRMRFGVG